MMTRMTDRSNVAGRLAAVVLATTCLTPLLLAAEAPGKEILHPVAVVIFGGLVSSTLLDTLLTPVLYLKFGRAATERLLQEPDEHTVAGVPQAAY